MRLTTVTQMTLPRGRIHSLVLAAHTTDGPALPISFDQRRHVEAGDRRGSWMAIAFRLPEQVARSEVSQAWAAVVERHGALQTVFDRDDDGRLRLRAADIEAHGWEEHDVADDVDPRAVLAGILDAACTPFAQPSHRVCLVKPGPVSTDADPRPMLVIASDHANVDMWSLLVLVRDLAECIDDLHDGRPAGSRLPRSVPAFSEHTAMLDARPPAPADVAARWGRVLDAGQGAMPVFPLPLGDVDRARPAVVAVDDVLDADGWHRLSSNAERLGVRPTALALSALSAATLDLAGVPLRAVFPVHSRYDPRWNDAVGWFITNSVIELPDPDPRACSDAVRDAISLGSHPLGPLLAPHGGMVEPPGMFALSWLDTRRMPLGVDGGFDVQYVSATVETDGVMVWFVINDDGLHVRWRHPDTPEAHRSLPAWIEAVTRRLQQSAHEVAEHGAGALAAG